MLVRSAMPMLRHRSGTLADDDEGERELPARKTRARNCRAVNSPMVREAW
jgi:hypothetical protein